MNFRYIFLSSAVALSAFVAMAVPAKPGLLTMEQADGPEIQVRLIGDEYSHYYLSEDGYLLAEENGNFYYADIDSDGEVVTSDLKAVSPALRSQKVSTYLAGLDRSRIATSMAAKRDVVMAARRASAVQSRSVEAASVKALPGLFPDADFPCEGEQKGLVILVNYSDVKMTTENANDYFTRMLNEPGFSDNGGTGSARDYFMECSGGRFIPEFDVYGPVELPKVRSYYGSNNIAGDDENAYEMIIDACRLLDDEIDFTEYDRNGDGYIDNVFVFYAGKGEATGGGSDTVWPHAWEIEGNGKGSYDFDGVTLNRYACSNEIVRNLGSDVTDGVGTFIHEFSHVMGLPDLYATSYGTSFTPGEWSVLDYGPYNNNGHTPPLYGAFERCALGWMTPAEISGPLSVVLDPISSNRAGIIRTSSENEYFLLENRQQEGWDTYIPGHGMLIWHIHYSSSIWSRNAVNNTSTHQYVDIEEADGVKTEASRSGDAFPGSAGITEFTNETTPSMGTWIGDILDLPITNIAETADGLISFDVAGGDNSEKQFLPTEVFDATDITYNSFGISWKEIPGSRYALSLYDSATMEPVGTYDKVLVGSDTSAVLSGLESDMEYAVQVFTGDDWQFGEPSNTVIVRTLPMTLDMRKVKVNQATDVTSGSFTASWEAVPGATDHLLTVYSQSVSDKEEYGCDFTNKEIAEGWSLSYDATFSPSSTYSGNSYPALSMTAGGLTLTSPVFSLPVAQLKFWMMTTKRDDTNNVTVHALVDDLWVKAAECPFSEQAIQVGGQRVTLTDFPEGTKAIRLEYVRGTSYGNLYIDDVSVLCHEPIVTSYVEGYNPMSLGDATSWTVSGLQPGQTYYYTVDATDGTLSAITSKAVCVSLPLESGSGIADVISSGSNIHVRAGSGFIEVVGAGTGTLVCVTDLLGRTVATVSSTGEPVLTIPVTSGLYIVKAGTEAVKVMIK